MSLDPKLATACYTRDGWKCRHCKNRAGLHPHHVVFKSHGGADALNNLLTLCHCCHIEGIHGGRLTIEVLAVLENDLLVKFIRQRGWIPR